MKADEVVVKEIKDAVAALNKALGAAVNNGIIVELVPADVTSMSDKVQRIYYRPKLSKALT